MYRCEVEGCGMDAVGNLCEFHQAMALKDNSKIIVCNNCGTIVSIREKTEGELSKYEFASECDLCDFINPISKPRNYENDMETGTEENEE